MGEIFERRSPGISLEWTGERLTSAVSGQVEIEHLHRYFLARQLCRGCDVLDVASGEGYGSALLAQVASTVIGVELDQKAVDHANTNYSASNLLYLQGDARKIPASDASVDVVVSFETIEHIYDQERFLQEVKRVLRPGGLFVVSSPNRDVYSPANSAANPYHARELTPIEFTDVLSKFFVQVALLFQRPLVGSALVSGCGTTEWMTFERRGGAHFEGSAGVPRSPYVVAVASDFDLPTTPDSLYIHTDEVGLTLSHAESYRALTDEVSSLRQRAETAEVALNELSAVKQNSDAVIGGLRSDLAAASERAIAAEGALNQLYTVQQNSDAVIGGLRSDLAAASERAITAEVALNQLCTVQKNSDSVISSLRGDLSAARDRAAEITAQYEPQLSDARDKNAQMATDLRVAEEQLANWEDLRQKLDHARAQEKLAKNSIRLLTAKTFGSRKVINEENSPPHEVLPIVEREIQHARAERDAVRAGMARLIAGSSTWRHRLQHAEARASEAERIAVEWRRLYDQIVKRLDYYGLQWLPKRLRHRLLAGK